MKKTIKLLAVMSVALLSGACENDKFTEDLPVVKDNVSFELDIQPILSAQCAGCHNPADVAPDLRKGFAYGSLTEDEGGIVPGDAEGSELMEMLEWAEESDNPMPPTTPISPLNIALIRKWIDEGALDN